MAWKNLEIDHVPKEGLAIYPKIVLINRNDDVTRSCPLL